jgi:signal transduction histidine kinase
MAHFLLIDGNPSHNDTLKMMLQFASHSSETFTSGTAAQARLESGSPPDGLISSILLDGVDGLRLCRAIKSRPEWASIPVIILGERDHDPYDEKLAKRAGANVFLRRPFHRDEFLAAVDQALLLAGVQENPLSRPSPQEEQIFLRDYNQWLMKLVYQNNQLLENTLEDLVIHDAHIYAMNTLTTALGGNLDLKDTAQIISSKVAEILRAQAVALYIHHEGHEFRLAYAAGFGFPTPSFIPSYRLLEGSPLALLYKRDQALLGQSLDQAKLLQDVFGLDHLPSSALVSPLTGHGDLTGFLVALRYDRDNPFKRQDANILFSVAGAAGLSLRSAILFHELAQTYEELRELDRRKSEFVAITSHELRTPIAIMLGYTSLLIDLEDDPMKRQQLETIEKQANFLTGMVDALLNLRELSDGAQMPKLRCTAIQIEELLREAWEVTQKHSSHKRKVDFHLDCDPVAIEGDEIRLLLAFNNLFDNAIKFSKDGGQVRVLVAERLEGGAVITIEDQGIGIDPEYHERIFEAFFQIEAAMTRHYGGLGLGLAIVKGMVELHEGTVEVKSQLGQGARFIVNLPGRLSPERCQQIGNF